MHNEEANIEAVVGALLRVLPAAATEWELLIVDDGSDDRTGSLADALARRDRRVRVIRHRTNRGYGAAVRAGLTAARHELVFFLDGDRQFNPVQIHALLARREDADLVVGYRRIRADSGIRGLYTWVWNALVRAVLGLRVRDVNCGFKLMRRDVVKALPLEASGATVSAELLTLAQRNGCRIAEVPVDHFPRQSGRPSGGRPDVIVRALVELGQLVRRLRQPAVPQPASASPLTVRDSSR
jgi:glycosyltransferase involved in cell wall biosynthesis